MTTCDCGTGWTGTGICHCRTCHLTFTSIGPFDEHRTGAADSRRCMTRDELRERGMEPNVNGQWRKPRPEESMPVDWRL